MNIIHIEKSLHYYIIYKPYCYYINYIKIKNHENHENLENLENLENFNYIKKLVKFKGPFTFYAWILFFIYQYTKNKNIGLVAFNCNLATLVGFEAFRFKHNHIANIYINNIQDDYKISRITFNILDFFVHATPLLILIKQKNNWNSKSHKKTFIISLLSFFFEYLWAINSSGSINVLKVYLNKNSMIINQSELNKLWSLVFCSHFFWFTQLKLQN